MTPRFMSSRLLYVVDEPEPEPVLSTGFEPGFTRLIAVASEMLGVPQQGICYNTPQTFFCHWSWLPTTMGFTFTL